MDTTNKYDEKIEAAKRWLGDRYLLAQPINQSNRKQRCLTTPTRTQTETLAGA